MAMASAVSRPSWNPLRCGGTALPVNLLVMAKAIAIALLVTNHARLLPDPFLPFIPGLDSIPHLLFQRTLQVVFVASALALIFNRSVRLAAFVLGVTIITAVVSSKAYYGNNKTFCGFILFLTGLYEPARGPWLIRLQLVAVYFGAGVNKLLDADWRTGIFFNNWAAHRLHQPVHLAGSRLLSPLLFTGSTFTMFFYAMTASMLAFVTWPTAPATVIYDGDCGFCARSKAWVEFFDLERMFAFRAYHSGVGHQYGIADDDAQQRLYLVSGNRIWSGFAAFRMMILWNPAAYLIAFAVLAIPGDNSKFRNITVASLLVFFSPIFAPVGEAAYRFIARNRHRLSAQSTCGIG